MNEKDVMRNLETAIATRTVSSYLKGSLAYLIPSDNTTEFKDVHLSDFAIQVYHKYAKMHPELKLDKMFVDSITSDLKSSRCTNITVYDIYKCIASELKIEHTDEAAFRVDKDQMLEILDILREKIEQNKEKFSMIREYQESKAYQDGAYGFFRDKSEEVFKDSGIRI